MRMGLWPCRAPMKRGSVSSAGKNRACTDKHKGASAAACFLAESTACTARHVRPCSARPSQNGVSGCRGQQGPRCRC